LGHKDQIWVLEDLLGISSVGAEEGATADGKEKPEGVEMEGKDTATESEANTKAGQTAGAEEGATADGKEKPEGGGADSAAGAETDMAVLPPAGGAGGAQAGAETDPDAVVVEMDGKDTATESEANTKAGQTAGDEEGATADGKEKPEPTAAALTEGVEEEEDTKTPKCSSGHLMEVSADYSGYAAFTYGCDGCGGQNTGARWFCSMCKADFCLGCYPTVRAPYARCHAPNCAPRQTLHRILLYRWRCSDTYMLQTQDVVELEEKMFSVREYSHTHLDLFFISLSNLTRNVKHTHTPLIC